MNTIIRSRGPLVDAIRHGLMLAMLGGALFASPKVHAGLTLATSPLYNSGTTVIKPNLMFTLDDSGSMNQDYTPDYVNDPLCFDSGDDGNTTLDSCVFGMPPYMSAQFNKQYYDPNNRYVPAVDSTGAHTGKYVSQTTGTSVYSNPFINNNTTDLVNTYSEMRWCTVSGGGGACTTNSTGYLYPDASNYKYSGGSVTAPGPYYYTIKNWQYCSDEKLTSCVTSDTPTTLSGVVYDKPAPVRWCNGTTDPATTNFSDCQDKKDGTHKYPRFLGWISSNTAAYAGISINGTPQAFQSISDITAGNGGYSIMTGTLSGYTTAAAAATAIANAINNKTSGAGQQEFIACVGNSTSTPGCNRSPFNTALAAQGITPSQVSSGQVYILPATASGGTTPLTGTSGNSLPTPYISGPATASSSNATGTISIADSSSDAPLCIVNVKIGTTTILDNTTNCATAGNTTLVSLTGTNASAERDALATLLASANFAGGRTAAAASSQVTFTGPVADNTKSITITASRAATATIKFPAAATITSIVSGSNTLTAGSVTGGSANTLASNVATSINSRVGITGFRALVTGTGDSIAIYGPLNVTTPSALTITQPSPVAATATITINTATSAKVNQVTLVPGGTCTSTTQIFNSGTNPSTSIPATLASAIASKITNAGTGYSATAVGNVITLTSPTSANYNGCSLSINVTSGSITTSISPFSNSNVPIKTAFGGASMSYLFATSAAPMSGGANAAGTIVTNVTGFTGGSAGTGDRVGVGKFERTNIVSTTTQYPKGTNRTDCLNSGYCTYAEELTNFSNWYAFYRTRIQTMKTAAGIAFSGIDSRYRVGFITINPSTSQYIPIADFTATQKTNWFNMFYSINPTHSTPLRSALSTVGRIFAGKNPLGVGGGDDPMQYSCQQNYVLLTTDGLWNVDSESDVKDIGGATIGNKDDTAALPYSDGNPGSCPSATPSDCVGNTLRTSSSKYSSNNTLADVAYYYYNTDIRNLSAFNNCNGALGVGHDVCSDSEAGAPPQRMVTFTLGLGVDGTLRFDENYKVTPTGDYLAITNGTLKWPQPKENDDSAVDDLWHAAVNGHGTYFSAKTPQSVADSLNQALSSIQAENGTGAAAASSNLSPVANDNFAFIGSYRTLEWTGNLVKHTLSISNGVIAPQSDWCVENVPGGTVNGVTTTDCTGTLQGMVSPSTDSRAIYAFDPSVSAAPNKLRPFLWGNLTPSEQAYFEPAVITTGLSQWNSLVSGGISLNATGSALVSYLRGQTGNEMDSSNPAAQRLFRDRNGVMFGDVVGSQPYYVRAANFGYTENNYAGYKISTSTRSPTVYVGANDGMLHAFNALTGVERWAFVPSQVFPTMYSLASADYANNHKFYVDGAPIASDIYCTSCSTVGWRTIIVGGLNAGGNGYYALDVTDPDDPQALWEFKTTSTCLSPAEIANGTGSGDCHVGNSYGRPVITKLNDGTWVVLVTSGYNNSSVAGTTGYGYLYVLNAMTGRVINRISTSVGSVASPSGLAQISGYADSPFTNNLATYVYGGDLLGNLWRFDINTTDPLAQVVLIATLKDPSNNPQPITTSPELALINSKRIVYVGTGKYLEITDLSTTQTQTMYGIADEYDTKGTLTDPRAAATSVAQVITNPAGTAADRIITSKPFSFSSKRDWYIDLPDTGERVNIPPLLLAGVLTFATTVSHSTECHPSGYSWLNIVDYATGGLLSSANGSAGVYYSSPIVGLTGLNLPSGTVLLVSTNNNNNGADTKQLPPPPAGGLGAYMNKRTSWRELLTD